MLVKRQNKREDTIHTDNTLPDVCAENIVGRVTMGHQKKGVQKGKTKKELMFM